MEGDASQPHPVSMNQGMLCQFRWDMSRSSWLDIQCVPWCASHGTGGEGPCIAGGLFSFVSWAGLLGCGRNAWRRTPERRLVTVLCKAGCIGLASKCSAGKHTTEALSPTGGSSVNRAAGAATPRNITPAAHAASARQAACATRFLYCDGWSSHLLCCLRHA